MIIIIFYLYKPENCLKYKNNKNKENARERERKKKKAKNSKDALPPANF